MADRGVVEHYGAERGHYHWRHEPCMYAVRRGKSAKWAGGRSESTVWEAAEDEDQTDHGTQKPIDLFRRPIRNHDFDLVYEPFGGSGTCLLAAEETRRRCLCMERTGLEVALLEGS